MTALDKLDAARVKPLVWECIGWDSGDGVQGENDDTWEAVPHGYEDRSYRIEWLGRDQFLITNPDDRDFRSESLSEAKAAAQSDYAARILSALVPAPPPDVAQDAGCDWCIDGLQADGETPCPCQRVVVPPPDVAQAARVLLDHFTMPDDYPMPTATVHAMRKAMEEDHAENLEIGGFPDWLAVMVAGLEEVAALAEGRE